MIRAITINNFKSIPALKLELGRVNVLIGENGCGKSNVLEGIGVGAAAAQDKLDNEFLISRGIRVVESRFMHSAFEPDDVRRETVIALEGDAGEKFVCHFTNKADPDSLNWGRHHLRKVRVKEFLAQLTQLERVSTNDEVTPEMIRDILSGTAGDMPQFMIYSPENSALRVFQGEGQVLPLSVKGEGLFAHLKALANAEGGSFVEIADRLALLDWFEGLEIPRDHVPFERSIHIRDRYLAEGAMFDQRSANEGFLFLLFYLTLFISAETPTFFAVDNIDASLNPKLCAELMRLLVELASKYGKQVIFTTHNPAILDGLNLSDDEQRLFVVYRNPDGHTMAHRVDAPRSIDGHTPMSLSQAFMRGFIGGLPENF